MALHAILGFEPEQYERLRQLREVALPSLYGLKGGAQPVPFMEDIGVPVAHLPEFMRRAQEILQEHETTASFLVHAAAGQVHTRPFLDLQNPEHVSRLWAIGEQIHTLALDLKGTVQYEKQVFLSGGSGTSQDLIGSTFSEAYLLKLPPELLEAARESARVQGVSLAEWWRSAGRGALKKLLKRSNRKEA